MPKMCNQYLIILSSYAKEQTPHIIRGDFQSLIGFFFNSAGYFRIHCKMTSNAERNEDWLYHDVAEIL